MSSLFLQRAKARAKRESEVREIDIEKAFCDYAKSKGCRALKLIENGKRGFPDRSILCPGGRIFYIEFKRPGKKHEVSAGQIKTMSVLESLGFECHVCDDLDEAKNILNVFLG